MRTLLQTQRTSWPFCLLPLSHCSLVTGCCCSCHTQRSQEGRVPPCQISSPSANMKWQKMTYWKKTICHDPHWIVGVPQLAHHGRVLLQRTQHRWNVCCCSGANWAEVLSSYQVSLLKLIFSLYKAVRICMFVPLWHSQFFMDLVHFWHERPLDQREGHRLCKVALQGCFEAEIEVECSIFYIGHR